jgi:hypothetical protein
MKVHAAPGRKCPMADNPRKYITDDAGGTDVPDTAYYRRLIADGSLVAAVPAPKPKAKGGDQ